MGTILCFNGSGVKEIPLDGWVRRGKWQEGRALSGHRVCSGGGLPIVMIAAACEGEICDKIIMTLSRASSYVLLHNLDCDPWSQQVLFADSGGRKKQRG